MRNFILIIIILMLTISCSSVKYYEYYENSCPTLDCSNIYSTLELHKDTAIYRGYSYLYLGQKKSIYLYIKTEKIDDLNFIPIWKAKTFYYYTDNNERVDVNYESLSYNDITQISSYIKYKNYYKQEHKLPEEYHFENRSLDSVAIWFPSELKRVKKIDYSKFPKHLQERINLKNPDAEKDTLKK